MKKRLLSFVLCGLVAVSCISMTSCGKTKIDDEAGDKSVLYVTNYNGGFGKDWIAEVENVSKQNTKTNLSKRVRRA